MFTKYTEMSDEKLKKSVVALILQANQFGLACVWVLLGIFSLILSSDLYPGYVFIVLGCFMLVQAHYASVVKEYLRRKGVKIESLEELRKAHERRPIVIGLIALLLLLFAWFLVQFWRSGLF